MPPPAINKIQRKKGRYSNNALPLREKRLLLFLRNFHPLSAQILDGFYQFVVKMEAFNIVATTDAFAVDEDVGYCSSAGTFGEFGLDLCAERV